MSEYRATLPITSNMVILTPISRHYPPGATVPDIKPIDVEKMRERHAHLSDIMHKNGPLMSSVLRDLHLHKIIVDAPLPWSTSMIDQSKQDEPLLPSWTHRDTRVYLKAIHKMGPKEVWTAINKIVFGHDYFWGDEEPALTAVTEEFTRLANEKERIMQEDRDTLAEMREIHMTLPEFVNVFWGERDIIGGTH